MIKVATIVARNYLSQARVLAASLKEHHPELTLQVLVLDDPAEMLRNEPDGLFDILRPEELDLSLKEFRRMATIYDVMELATALKPWLLKHLLESGAEVALYFDPDIEIFHPFGEIKKLALENEVVLTPHNVDPMPRDGRFPRETDILQSGVYNLGFIAVSKNAQSFLKWWQERLTCDGISSVAEGLFVDQRWVDFLPALFPHFILKDPGFNVAYWNLDARKIQRKNGGFSVNGVPLRFFHFSGYSPDVPYLLSKHQGDKPRILLSEHPEVALLCREYGQKLIQAGFGKKEDLYGYTYSADGLELTIDIRRLCRDFIIKKRKGVENMGELPDPFDPAETAAFTNWLKQPAPSSPNRKISRFLQYAYDQRPDLQIAFPKLYGQDAARYIDWARNHSGFPQHLVYSHEQDTTSVQDVAVPRLKPGINVGGYLNTESGMGEAGRSLVAVLEKGNIPFSVIPPFKLTQSRQNKSFDEAGVGDLSHDINIICVNADQFPIFVENVGHDLLKGRYTIGFWAWELEKMPVLMSKHAAELMDEIWVYSQHSARAVSAVVDKPVFCCPLPIIFEETPSLSRAELGLPEGFNFLFCFDFFSVMQRKNPLALIEAFKSAFTPGEGPNLVIKTINGSYNGCLLELEQLRAAATGRPDIIVLEGYLSRDRQRALMSKCDAYVSLHRAEGYGLTLAEAMSMAKPVIGTGYSGNMEFMNDKNSYLVPYTMAEIPPGCEPYPSGYLWAEPDIGAAARFMREIYDDPDSARIKAEQARRDIKEHFSPEARVAFIKERLERIRKRRQTSPQIQVETAHAPESAGGKTAKEMAAEYLASNPDPRSPSRFGWLSPAARRLTFRILRHYDLHQRQTGQALLQAVNDADAQRDTEFTQLSDSISSIDARLKGLQTLSARLKALEEKSFDLTVSQKSFSDSLNSLNSSITATPYMSDPSALQVTGEDGRKTLGYKGLKESANGSFYLGFENIFRGSEDFVRERQRRYLQILGGHEPVIDAGCGRGEMLELLAKADIPATGVDANKAMVDYCIEKGLRVEHADINKYLGQLKDGSISAIFSAQVIEHMSHSELMKFMELAHVKLKPQGMLITETVNPHSPAALKTFWLDPSHHRPIFPEAMIVICRHFGFAKASIIFPNGTGEFEKDLIREGEYAVIATKSIKVASTPKKGQSVGTGL